MSPRKVGFEPYATTVFCDDIRHEVGNKNTLVGAYAADLIVPEIPIILPKLGFAINVVSPRFDQHVEIELQIFFPGDPPDAPTISIPNSVDLFPPGPEYVDDDVPKHSKILHHLVLSPVELKAEGLMKVRMTVGSQRIRAGVLYIRKADPGTLKAAALTAALSQ